MSTELITFTAYINNWTDATTEEISDILQEHELFVNLGEFESEKPVNDEFANLVGLARTVEDLTIAEDGIGIAADAAAVASIFTFGLGMAAFAALTAAKVADAAIISRKSKELNEKLVTADTDITERINPQVATYVTLYKKNNTLIASKAPAGVDQRHARSILMTAIGEMDKTAGRDRSIPLTVMEFKNYAKAIRRLYDCKEVTAVYDSFDDFVLGPQTDKDLEKLVGGITGFTLPGDVTGEVYNALVGISTGIMFYNLNVSRGKIAEIAKTKGIEPALVEESALDVMDSVGKACTAIAVILSVVDVVFSILDIVDVVKQSNEMVKALNGPIKSSYLKYYTGLKESSCNYKAAMAGKKLPYPPTPSPPPSSSSEFRIMKIYPTAPIGMRAATVEEVRAHKSEVTSHMDNWGIARIQHDWKIDGLGYGNNIGSYVETPGAQWTVLTDTVSYTIASVTLPPKGWRLATNEEVTANLKNIEPLTTQWGIYRLAAGFKFSGGGYKYGIANFKNTDRPTNSIIVKE